MKDPWKKTREEIGALAKDQIKVINYLAGKPKETHSPDFGIFYHIANQTPKASIEAALSELTERVAVKKQIKGVWENQPKITNLYIKILWKMVQGKGVWWNKKTHLRKLHI